MPYRFARRRPLDRRAWLALVALLLLPACAAPVPFVGGSGGDPVVADGIPKETVGAPVLDDAAARADSLDGNGGGAGTGATAEAGTARVDEALDSIIAERVDSPPVVPEPPRPWAEVTLEGMTLREKVGQLLMPWVLGDYAPAGSASHERIVGYIEEHGVGGVIMSVGQPTEVAVKLNDLQKHSKVPLLVAADLETGAGFRMRGAVHVPGNIDLGGATDFPSQMAVGAAGDPQLAYEMGRITALEARAVGVHVPFAPVLDVNNNPENPIINVRAFGEDPADVALMGAAYVTGVQDHGAIATGKHFPGHGDTDTDSHLALPVIRHDRARMDAVELRPFQAAIDAGMGAIMTAHISVPTLTGGNPDPATLSPYVLTTILRHQMGFDGLVFTDAMDMSAIARGRTAAEAAVRAVEAGADVILMPASVPAAINGIVTAVERGRIPEERIDRSVRRLLAMKVSLGLDTLRAVPIDGLKEVVGIPAHNALAEEIAQRSMTVLKNDRGLLPLLGTRNARVLSVTYRRSSDILAGRYFNQHLRSVYPRLSTFELDGDANGDRYDELRDRVRDNVLVVVGTYVTAVSYQGSVAVPDDLVEFIQYLDEIDVPHVVVSFGNPYLISDFPDVQAYMLGWSGSRVSQRAAAGALLGEFEVGGRTPTRIPPGYEIGAGMRIPARARPRGH